jgi:hypothetical protein
MVFPVDIFQKTKQMPTLISTFLLELSNALQISRSSNEIQSVLMDSCFAITAFSECDEYLFIGTTHGLFQKNKKNGHLSLFTKTNSKLPDNHINCLACNGDGYLYIGTSKGLVRRVGKKSTLMTTANSTIPEDTITSIAIDKKNNLWIGFEHTGVALFKQSTENKFIFTQVQTEGKNIYSITIDPYDGVWVSHKDGTLDYFKDGIPQAMSNTYCEPLPPAGKEKFLLLTSHDGPLLTDGCIFEEICPETLSGKITCAYYHPKYSRMILCDSHGVNIFSIKDPWSGYRNMHSSEFIRAISYRNHYKLN